MSPQEMLSILESMATDLDYKIQVGEVQSAEFSGDRFRTKPSQQARLIYIWAEAPIEQRLQTIRAAMVKAPELALYEIDRTQEIAMGNYDRAGQSRAA